MFRPPRGLNACARVPVAYTWQLHLNLTAGDTDDDGDETAIKSDLDLVEAVQYFGSGCDDNVSSYTSATASTSASFDSTLTGGGSGGEKVTLRIQVVVEYDGPALSETGSIAESLSDRESGWGGDNDGASGRSSQWTEGSEEWAEGQAERDRRDGVASGTRVVIEEDWDDESIDLSHDPFLPLAPERSSVPSHPLAQSFGPSSSSSSSSDSQSARLASIGSSPISEGFLADFDPSTPSHDDAGTLHPADHDADWGAVEGNDDVDARTSMPYDGADAIEHGGPKDAEPSSETRYTTRSTVASSVPSIDGPQSSRESRLSSSRQVNGQSGSSGNSQRQPSVPSSSHSTASSAASGLEQSEFGARWLREQGEMLKKRAALPGARPVADNKGKQRSSAISALSDDDDDNSNFVEGALALERAESGKWYYNYSAGSSRDSLGIDGDKRLSRSSGSSLRPFAVGSSSTPPSSIPTSSAGSPSFVGGDQPPISLNSKSRHGDHQPSSSQSAQLSSVEGIPLEVLRIAAEEETGVVAPPKYAPDCSACGIRLTYMRYACTRVRHAAGLENCPEPLLTILFSAARAKSATNTASCVPDPITTTIIIITPTAPTTINPTCTITLTVDALRDDSHPIRSAILGRAPSYPKRRTKTTATHRTAPSWSATASTRSLARPPSHQTHRHLPRLPHSAQ